MGVLKFISILALWLTCTASALSQVRGYTLNNPGNRHPGAFNKMIFSKDSVRFNSNRIYIVSNAEDFKKLPKTCSFLKVRDPKCKLIELVFVDTASIVELKAEQEKNYSAIPDRKREAIVKVHGNVMYEYFYQSYLDTPYSGHNLQQHTISTYLNVLVKDKYPFKVSLTGRFDNSEYIRNFTGVNFAFDEKQFAQIIRSRAENYLKNYAIDTSSLKSISNLLDTKVKALKDIVQWLYDPSITQQLVEAKERYIASQNKKPLPAYKDTLTGDWYSLFKDINPQNADYTSAITKLADKKTKENKDSIYERFLELYNSQRTKADSIAREVTTLKEQLFSKRRSLDSAKIFYASKMRSYSNLNNLKDSLEEVLPDTIFPKRYALLSSIRKLSVGTATVDYSELSVKNITVSGIQIEVNPKWYYAVAGGIIRYRFRDYLLPENRSGSQYLGLVRFGKGKPESNHLYFTYYFGKRKLYNYNTAANPNAYSSPNGSLTGITLEQKIMLSENISVTAEFAKSSIPYYNRINQTGKLLSGSFDFGDRSNEAYSIKANINVPKTNTRMEGYYKRYGENFQSFTLYLTNSRQRSWQMRISQMLFKKQLVVNASIRKNDFMNPFLDQQYASNTIFKSFQASLRVRKLPIVSIGYYPTTQIVKLSDQKYMDYLYNNLYGSIQHYYKAGTLQMSSSIIATKFYNRQTDSNFVYYNASNISFSQSVVFKKFTLQGMVNQSKNASYTLHTYDIGLQTRINKNYAVGCNVKYNKQNILTEPQIGYSVYGTIPVLKTGGIQLRFQKTYIPGPERKLVPDNIGRLSFYQNF